MHAIYNVLYMYKSRISVIVIDSRLKFSAHISNISCRA